MRQASSVPPGVADTFVLGVPHWSAVGERQESNYFPARGPAVRATPPYKSLIQRLRAGCLPRAFAAFDQGHGSRGGALAQVFAESATL